MTAVIGDGRVRLSDPKPAYCSACLRGAEEGVDFVDFGAAFDAGSFVRPDDGQVIEGSDDLHLCAACVKLACEQLGFKPQLHARQLEENRQLKAERDEWRETAIRLQGEQADRFKALFDATEPTRRKAA